MDATDLEARVRADRETELSRLSSSKALYAATGGEMDREAVVRAAADRAAAAHECYRAWADDGPGADRFEEVAAAEADRLATVEALGATGDPDRGPREYDRLAEFETPAERAGGLLGETLVTDAAVGQTTAFFVGDADPQTASTFREMGEEIDQRREAALALVEAVAADETDRERAREAADAVVEAAYGAYVDGLEAIGVNPKPVC
jgi:hypothetical protein